MNAQPDDIVRLIDPVENTESTPLLVKQQERHRTKMPTIQEKVSRKLGKRKLLVDLFSMFFGVGAWIGVNSTFNELPILVDGAPEGWSLPSYLSVIVQAANLGPLVFSVLKKWTPIKEKYLIYFILFIGVLSALCMAFFHQKTSYIFGEKHSTALLVLMFTSALVGCTSSVLFMPYMGLYREVYLITYLIGEGLSGFIPSIISLIQGIDTTECRTVTDKNGTHLEPYTPPAHFSTRVYFLIEFSILIISFASFLFLNNLKISKSQLVNKNGNRITDENILPGKTNSTVPSATSNFVPLSKSKFRGLCYFMGVLCLFGNGVLPSIQSFSCLPYGNKTYHLAVSLSLMANPLACMLALFLPHTSFMVITTLTSITGIFSVYVFTMAVLSPNPLLVDSNTGAVLMIISWIIVIGLLSYTKLCVTSIFRKQGGQSSLFWCGAFSQMGSALGALIMFLVINFGHIFKQYSPCENK